MDIETIVVGPLEVNCYLVYESDGTDAIVIDPGDDVDLILNAADNLGVNVKQIINTHGHFDHIGGNRKLKEKTGASISIHKDDLELLRNAGDSAVRFGLTVDSSPEPDELLNDGQIIEEGKMKFKVIHTPGHSPGGISLLSQQVLFTGDTLFAGSIGRTDLPGGSYKQLIESIKSKLFRLDGTCMVYPGHGAASTIENEKNNNPFLQVGLD